MNKIDSKYTKALKEVYIILEAMGDSILSKIPESFMNFIIENMDINYIFFLDEDLPIESQNLSNEALGIISLIYRDYIATDEERENIVEDEKNKLKQLENELNKKYPTDKIFERLKSKKKEKMQKDIYIVERKKSIFDKIKNFLNKIF